MKKFLSVFMAFTLGLNVLSSTCSATTKPQKTKEQTAPSSTHTETVDPLSAILLYVTTFFVAPLLAGKFSQKFIRKWLKKSVYQKAYDKSYHDHLELSLNPNETICTAPILGNVCNSIQNLETIDVADALKIVEPLKKDEQCYSKVQPFYEFWSKAVNKSHHCFRTPYPIGPDSKLFFKDE